MTLAPLWTVADIVAATGGTPTSETPFTVTGVSIDSRTLIAGDLFVAIRGEAGDGHAYVEAALKAGAAAALVDHAPQGLDPSTTPLVQVGDTLKGLEALGRAARARAGAKVIGITGSVGKTSTKEMLALVLGQQGKTHASAASYNNHWGVPLSLSRLPTDTRFAVFEIGMNHPGEITPLTRLVRPDIAIITTIEAVHLEFFKTTEAIATAKAEIFLGMDQNGTAILNRDNPHFTQLATAATACGVGQILSFGEDPASDAKLRHWVPAADHSLVDAEISGQKITYTIGAAGRHLVMNSLAVLLAAHQAGADLATAAAEMAHFKSPKGRGLRQSVALPDGGDFLLVDESYNASPASVKAALAAFGQVTPDGQGRRIAILGDMRELGEDGPALHQDLAGAVCKTADILHCCGPLMRHLYDAVPAEIQGIWAEDSAALAARLRGEIQKNDIVLVKGSLGSRMATIMSQLLSLPSAS
jgi:UDP-N-acetylmuramoyl-tripeptide--D-alanyl-D-alanine ligase